MPIFISYSHKDIGFADKIAVNLVKSKVGIWLDRWELNVGDSLVDKIQEAIEQATGIILIISKAFVESEWCRKEMSSGIVRELEERKILILPILIENCKMPLFLKDKLYADFRTNFDEGWQSVLSSVSSVASLDMGRIGDDAYHTDWGEDWGYQGVFFVTNYTLVQFSDSWNHTILTQISIRCNSEATSRYNNYDECGLGWFGRFVILESIVDGIDPTNSNLLIEDSFPKASEVTIFDPRIDVKYDVKALVVQKIDRIEKGCSVGCCAWSRQTHFGLDSGFFLLQVG